MKPVYQIKEYCSFITGREAEGYITIPEQTFTQLENFILTSKGKSAEALELMGISARKAIGRVITAKNYVGVIAMPDGTIIEILPKICSDGSDDKNGIRTKKLLIHMLKTLRNAPYKSLQTSDMDIARMNIFEIFVRIFLDEVFLIVKRGLRRSYETVEENTAFFRGKMQFAQQIRLNCIHRERSYVEYGAFTVNRPENRLLKAALEYLHRCSAIQENRKDIKILLNSFSGVGNSTDYKSDFSRCAPERNMKDYSTALQWSRVFLEGKSFTAFSGAEAAMALLFPMETLFEGYVSALLRKELPAGGFEVSVQDKTFYLFDEPEKKFMIKPDIVVKRKSDGAIFIMDTKWKVLDADRANYGITQADMYQMFAYQKKYSARYLLLLYPRTEKVPSDKKIEFRSYDGVNIQIKFVDLFHAHSSISEIARFLYPDTAL